MERATQSPGQVSSNVEGAQNESGLFSSESLPNILRLISAGSPLPEILNVIARLVESQGEGLFCTIWLPDEQGNYLYCAAAPSLPGFSDHVGRMEVSPKGASCGTAVYRREPVYVTDILADPRWDDYRQLMLPYGIRSVWSRPLFTSEGKVLGTFAILYREARSPGTSDLQLIEDASHITGIAIERHINEAKLRQVVDTIPALVWSNLPDGPNDFSNQRWQDYTGISSEEAQGWGWQAAVHPDDLPKLMETWLGMVAAGKAGEFEARLRRKNGVFRWFLCRIEPLRDESGKVLRWFGTATDIDTLKQTEEKLREDERERERLKDELRHERDRLRLLLEITNSMTSKLDLRRLVEVLSTSLLRVTRCDFCALLLPDADSGQLRVTTLYNPEARGSLCDGTLIPIHGSSCDKAFRTGKTQHFNNYEEVRDDPEYFGSSVGRPFYQRVVAEGLVSGCDLPLVGRGGVVGVLAALKRSERAYSKDDVTFLEQVAGQVAIAVENALDYEKATKDRDKETKQRLYLEEEIRSEFTEIVGESRALKTALSLVSVVAPTDSTVLVLGETGTGKELVARAIHKLSSRSEKAFVKLNCAAIPLGLLESELFGHEKGAFTGAIGQKTGRFELADKGTLFLDEVGDIPLELQAKLLRVLQEQEFERLGSNRTHKVDVRLIAATHRDLPAMVKQGAFREDLYYRMKVFPILIPALRQRAEDIPKLVRHFTEVYARRVNKKIEEIPSETMDALVRYRWPGNVRELQNFIERAVILSPHTTLRAPTSELEPSHAPKQSEIILTGLAQVERDHILRALEASNWVIAGANGAAVRLGMKRTSFVYRMKKLGISRPAASPQKLAAKG
jgi:formate hydrogenlyase transcriptional activator